MCIRDSVLDSPPNVWDVRQLVEFPDEDDWVPVTARASVDSGWISFIGIAYNNGISAGWQLIPMRDDGEHQDDEADDGVYGAFLPPHPDGTVVRYVVFAEDQEYYSAYSPAGAPEAVYRFKVGYQPPKLYLNELMPDNASTIADGAGEFDPWFEIYNDEDTPVNISNMFLTNSLGNSTQWLIPPNMVCLLYTSPSPRDRTRSRMPSSA